MYYWIVIGVSVLVSLVNIVFMQLRDEDKEKSVASKITSFNVKSIILSVVMIAVMVLASWYLTYVNYERGIAFILKRVAWLSILWPCAVIDFKKHIIPNSILVITVLYRAIIAVLEAIMYREAFVANIVSEIVIALIMLVLCMLCRLIIKNSIGYGDVKLIICMGLLLGINSLVNALFASLLVSFFVAIYMLMAKKKTKKDNIAFAPCVLVGTIISYILVGA